MSSVLTFLNDAGINYTPSTENDVLVSCFNKQDHKNGDKNPSLSVNIEKGYFKCWSCKISGNFAQLMGGLGHFHDINNYIKGYDKSKLKYDINTLKSQSSDIINIPGVGKFYKNKDSNDNDDLLINSRKINVNDEILKLSQLVTSGNGTIEDRKKLIELMESTRLNQFKIPENYQKVNYLEYLCERGLPNNFCTKNEVYVNKANNKYFALPIKNFRGDTVNLLNISHSRETTPRMYSEIKNSNPILGFNEIDYKKDIYIVEGWLDYLKMREAGYNCFPTLSNHFNNFHFSILQQCSGNKFFIFDNDVPGVSMLEDVLNYISRSDSDWYGLFLDPRQYKDIGDVDLLRIEYELKNSVVEKLLTFKKYKLLLGMEKYNANKKIIHSDGYTLRSDPFFTDIRKSCGERDKETPGRSFVESSGVNRESKFGYPW